MDTSALLELDDDEELLELSADEELLELDDDEELRELDDDELLEVEELLLDADEALLLELEADETLLLALDADEEQNGTDHGAGEVDVEHHALVWVVRAHVAHNAGQLVADGGG